MDITVLTTNEDDMSQDMVIEPLYKEGDVTYAEFPEDELYYKCVVIRSSEGKLFMQIQFLWPILLLLLFAGKSYRRGFFFNFYLLRNL